MPCVGLKALLLLAVTLVTCVFPSHAAEDASFPRIEQSVLDSLARIPIQDGGRIKPLDTYARFMLLKFYGSRTLRVREDGELRKIGAIEWLAISLLFPQEATHLPLFRVDNSDVIVAVGATPHEKRRDRYTFAELIPAREKLYELGRQYGEMEADERNPHQSMIVALAHNISDYEFLLRYTEFAREHFSLEPGLIPGLPEETDHVTLSEFLHWMPSIRSELKELMRDERDPSDEIIGALAEPFTALQHYSRTAMMLKLFPPPSRDSKSWRSAGDLIAGAMLADEEPVLDLELLEGVEALITARDNPGELDNAARDVQRALASVARVRGEYKRIPLEVTFYRINFFSWSLTGYLLSFLMVSFSWLSSQRGGAFRGWSQYSFLALLSGSTLMLIAGITVRCIIRGRPPVSTLYETILFITAVAVLVCVIMEYMNRRGIAIGMAPILGLLGMFLANKYEAKEAIDTMPSLQAVLDTNFWLATHVTCVTIGYAAGLLAGALAHVYILGRVFRVRAADPEFYASLGRMVYGVVCFTLFFSFIGTMLGGIWANYSWGRFWGWDPKENGALMIVLWQLIILHAKMGRYVQDFGVCMLAIIGACIIAFSWWGVNLLGVGLHSYGFTQGIWGALMAFWGFEAVVLLVATITRKLPRSREA
jgi:ABC-type transport system involved in cytochrome c biogenesis permease subunit